MKHNIFTSPSFWALSSEDREAIQTYVDHHGEPRRLDIRPVYLKQFAFLKTLNDAEERLVNMQRLEGGLGFLSAEQKIAWEGELMLIYYQLSVQFELDRIQRVSHALPARAQQIRSCARLINLLRLSRVTTHGTFELQRQTADSEQYTQFLGLRLIVPALLETIDDLTSSRKKTVRDFIAHINERRLYWVWAGGMISAILTALPASFADTSNASHTLGMISPIGGSLSWILYFTRAGLVWSGLIGHSFEFAMGEEERELGFTWSQRWRTHWQVRKYRLLNDSIWGLCNAACFFVLVGSGLAGYLGNVLTAALLLMDVIITIYSMYEQQTEHEANMHRYQQTIERLELEIQTAEKKNLTRFNKVPVEVLKNALKEVQITAFKARLDWKFKHMSVSMDLMYAVSLIAAFCVVCCFFFPPAGVVPATALILGLVGISLCFLFNFAYMSASMTLQVSKVKALKTIAEKELVQQLRDFTTLAKRLESPYEAPYLQNKLKFIFLNIEALKLDSRHQEKMVTHQQRQLLIATIRDALIPPLFIASLVFMPLGVGIPLLILGLTLMICVTYGLSWMKPEKSAAPNFDEVAFENLRQQALTHSVQSLRSAPQLLMDQDNGLGFHKKSV